MLVQKRQASDGVQSGQDARCLDDFSQTQNTKQPSIIPKKQKTQLLELSCQYTKTIETNKNIEKNKQATKQNSQTKNTNNSENSTKTTNNYIYKTYC
jgi:hypothetical protein